MEVAAAAMETLKAPRRMADANPAMADRAAGAA
jgi:hypothetical protein